MINDGGMIIVEDVHQSLSWTVGNPHRFSFFQFLKLIERCLLEKSPGTKKLKSKWPAKISKNIYAIEIFQSMVALKFDSYKAQSNFPIVNHSRKTSSQNDSSSTAILTLLVSRLKRFWEKSVTFIKHFSSNYSNIKFFK